MRKNLVNFITNNELKFEEGRRNSDCVVICGYAQYIGADYEDVKNAITIVLESSLNDELSHELEKIWIYCWDNDYANWWDDQDNRDEYILD